jgi:hypothetical protein
MSDSDTPSRTVHISGSPVRPNRLAGVSADDFRDGFGEELRSVLDLSTWTAGRDLDEEYHRIEREVRESVDQENEHQRAIRDQVFPRLPWAPSAPKHAGVHTVQPTEIPEIHRGLLFPGAVEACDGTVEVHETLPLTIYQIGVALVSYRGNLGTWCHRLFRKDLRQHHDDPANEALELLNRRGQRSALNHESPKDGLSQLARRAVMSYAERAALVRMSNARWRIGHGAPAEYQLIAGAGNPDLMILSVRLMRELIEQHPKFVFVSSEPADRLLLTIGQALRPLEYAVVYTLADRMRAYLDELSFSSKVTVDNHWDGEALSPERWVLRFRDVLASRVVVGVYRATRFGPAHVFYAHEDWAPEAARVVIADSALQEHRGWPMLIDLADQTCKAVYGGSSLREMANAAYAAAGMPFRYASERMTRDR